MKANPQQGRKHHKDAEGGKTRTVWPVDVMISAASMVVDQKAGPKRVSDQFGIPYTTLHDWVRKYRSGGAAAFEKPASGSKAAPAKRKVDPSRNSPRDKFEQTGEGKKRNEGRQGRGFGKPR